MICEIFISTICCRLENFSKLCGASRCSQWCHLENGGLCEKKLNRKNLKWREELVASPKVPDPCEGTEIDFSNVRAQRFSQRPGINFKLYPSGLQVKNLNPERNAAPPLCDAALTGFQWDVLGTRPALEGPLDLKFHLVSFNDGKLCLNWVTNVVKDEELPQMDWERSSTDQTQGSFSGGSSWSIKNQEPEDATALVL